MGSIKSVMRISLSDRAMEISQQISLKLQNHQKQILNLITDPGLKTYARNLEKNNVALPDQNLRNNLAAFLLGNQQKYSSLIGVNRQGNPVFKIEARPSASGVLYPFLQDRNFSSEDSIGGLDLISNIKPDSVQISEIQNDSSGPHVKLIAPLRDGSNSASGAMVLKVRTDELLREAAGPGIAMQSPQTETAHTEVIIVSPDQQGTVLYARDPMKEWKPYNAAFPQLEQAISSLRTEKDKDLDWPPLVIRHRLREENPKLSIFVVENYKSAVGSLEFDSYVLLLLTLLLVVVAMLALYYLISSFTDSIRNVTKGAKAIATGNLNYQIKVKTKDETRVLAEAFNRMAARLREMIRKEGEQKQFESFARLSAVLTHDLKNQILSLSLLVSNMERKFDREGFREDAMRTLSDSVNNLQNLVAKLSDPRTPTKRIRERSNLTHLVERVVQRTAGQATNRFKVAAQLTPDLYAIVDGKAIERVIENLVINALEAMPEGGSLNIATRSDNGQAVISISDTGKGMTEEFIRERLFQPFATTKKKGIGLGLYSCRDVIEQHGGRIDVASKVEVGTEFRIVLPILIEEAVTRSDSGALVAAGILHGD
ncbi:MAG TPA: ATP-binding protein [Blastocatellia bacterium]|nr:ATP-binding protein [Blastocatellia bacterium]